jgi:hypothetical protein
MRADWLPSDRLFIPGKPLTGIWTPPRLRGMERVRAGAGGPLITTLANPLRMTSGTRM